MFKAAGYVLVIGVIVFVGVNTGYAQEKVIFDTDMASDVDDAGALAMLHALADRGEAEILAIGVSDRNPWSPLCVDAINTYYGHPDLPIGVTKDPDPPRSLNPENHPFDGLYPKVVANEFPGSNDWDSADDAPDAVEVYRRVLASQPDSSVVFLSVGFLTNLSNLLDQHPNLVRRKVKHYVAMGGEFEGDDPEFNIREDLDASRTVLNDWPTEITFSPFRIGRAVSTGGGLSDVPKTNPVRRAYEEFNGIESKASFDQVATLYAIRGLGGGPADDYWSLSPWGWVSLDGKATTFTEAPDGRHRYQTSFNREVRLIEREIGRLMRYVPDGK